MKPLRIKVWYSLGDMGGVAGWPGWRSWLYRGDKPVTVGPVHAGSREEAIRETVTIARRLRKIVKPCPYCLKHPGLDERLTVPCHECGGTCVVRS